MTPAHCQEMGGCFGALPTEHRKTQRLRSWAGNFRTPSSYLQENGYKFTIIRHRTERDARPQVRLNFFLAVFTDIDPTGNLLGNQSGKVRSRSLFQQWEAAINLYIYLQTNDLQEEGRGEHRGIDRGMNFVGILKAFSLAT